MRDSEAAMQREVYGDVDAGGGGAGAGAGAGVPVLAQSFAQWRDAARALLVRRIAPQFVQWIAAPDAGDLFASAAPSFSVPLPLPLPSVPLPSESSPASVPLPSESSPASVPLPSAPSLASVPSPSPSELPSSRPPSTDVVRLPRELIELLERAACCRVARPLGRAVSSVVALARWRPLRAVARGPRRRAAACDGKGGPPGGTRYARLCPFPRARRRRRRAPLRRVVRARARRAAASGFALRAPHGRRHVDDRHARPGRAVGRQRAAIGAVALARRGRYRG